MSTAAKLLKLATVIIITAIIHGQAGANVYKFTTADSLAAAIPVNMTYHADSLVNYITNRIRDDELVTRTIFKWIANNIGYRTPKHKIDRNLLTLAEDSAKILQTRRGVCEDYSKLFKHLCNKAGIQMEVVTGMVNIFGEIPKEGHAWNAGFVNGQWKLYDVTWAAGYVAGNKFTFSYNEFYFDTPPDSFVLNHLPSDYMWQLLPYPKHNYTFYKSKKHAPIPYTNVDSLLESYFKADSMQRIDQTLGRMKMGGISHAAIQDDYDYALNVKTYYEKTTYHYHYAKAYEAYVSAFNIIGALERLPPQAIGEETLQGKKNKEAQQMITEAQSTIKVCLSIIPKPDTAITSLRAALNNLNHRLNQLNAKK
ncbi:MAG: hypothetical protein RIQ89_903 [Bacteroidota bacterium]|jgi:hypothetical protein